MHRNPLNLARLRRLHDVFIRAAQYGPAAPVDIAVHEVRGEPVGFEQAAGLAFEPVEAGAPYGSAWNTAWFRIQGKVPAEWAGAPVALALDLQWRGGAMLHPNFAGEALVWHHGVPAQGISMGHTRYRVCQEAAGGDVVEVFVEASAIPRPPSIDGTWPLLLPDPDGPPLYRLGAAALVPERPHVAALARDWRLVLDLAESVGADSAEGAVLVRALDQAARALDPQDVPGTAAAAHAALAAVIDHGDRPDQAGPRVVAVGHGHIDTAWLWPKRETMRKCARTFSSVVRLMDDHPDFRFACSQAQQYEWVRDRYPALFARIKEKVAAGQWEPVGSMWVEPDCNVPSGESLVRQLVYGKRFFADELGVETVDAWLPDTFGFPASLPQILRLAGVSYFMTTKLSWSAVNRFPHHTFRWEGIDGSAVLAHLPPGGTYSAPADVAHVRQAVAAFAELGAADALLYPFGHGDGGGGPTDEMIESLRAMAGLAGGPSVAMGSVRSFFEEADLTAGLPTWVGELYLELHRGTYTTQAAVKKANRAGEVLLHGAELWAALAAARTGRASPAQTSEALEVAWKGLLTEQFHDILPGSGIHWVYQDAADAHRSVAAAAEGIAAAGAEALVAGVDTAGFQRAVAVFNDVGRARVVPVEVAAEGDGPVAARGPDGVLAPAQRIDGGRVLFHAAVPSMGYAVYDVVDGDALDGADGEAPAGEGAVVVADRSMDNGLVRIEWDDDGLLTSVWDTRAGREVLAPGARGNLLQLHPDHPRRWDAWDVDPEYREQVTDLVAAESVEVVERGPLRGGVRIVRRFGSSTVEQVVRLSAGSAVVEFDTTVDWQERHAFLKAAFPVAVRSDRAAYEIQFGHCYRTTHENTSWDAAQFEVCGHRWADLSETGFGVALLNDCKYGYDVHGSVLRLSLLRGPTHPDPVADQGVHRFRYGLLPHCGGPGPGGVVDAGYAFNHPARVVEPSAAVGGKAPVEASLLWVDQPSVVIETVKPADAGDGIVVRLYEAWGGRCRVRLGAAFDIAGAVVTDLLERDLGAALVEDGGVVLDVLPFQIVTVKLSTRPQSA